MCGIAGVLVAGRDAARVAAAMHESLAHRGPDGEAVEQRGDAILCHRRLSIIDLSPAGAQPMADATGALRITYNGEIYNYRELRDECIRRGAEFRSSTDTEVVLNLFRLDGERAFSRLNGMFAFCLTDDRTGEAWLVRDPMGIKPLYWSETRHGVAFASELRALLDARAVPFEVDAEALQAYLRMDFVPSPMSMVKGIRKLPGGTLLHIQHGLLTERAYPPPTADRQPPTSFDAVIRAAVERQLIADVPVGVFLSGGIDSSIIAKVATDVAGRISTFSIAFDDPSFDESRWFDEAARVIGSDHHTERLTSKAMLDLVPGVARVASEPLADGSIFPTMLLARFARQHVKVALSGDGADELFAGYPTHRVINAGRTFAILPRPIRRAMTNAAHALLPVSHANLSLEFRIKKFLEGADRDEIVQNEQWLGTFNEHELPQLLTSYEPLSLDELWHDPSRAVEDRLERVLRTDRRFYLQDGVLVKTDRASMAASLEVRVPMLDLDMVRFADALPPRDKLRGGTTKWILRQWAREHFPRSIWHRPKKGFGVPLGQWFRGELRPLLRDTLSSEAVARDGFFRPATVQRLVDEHERGRRDHRKRLFNLLMFTLWYRQFAR